ncbi:hypothetical protein ACWDTQ_12530, partial [Streptomyces cellulosae]
MIARLRHRRAERDGTYDELVARRTKAVARLPGRQNDLVENLMEVTRFDAGTARLVLDDVDVVDQI